MLTQFNTNMSNYNRDNDIGCVSPERENDSGCVSQENSECEIDEEDCRYVKSNGNFEDISTCLNKLLESNQEINTTAQFMQINEPNQECLEDIQEKATRSIQYSLVLKELIKTEDENNKISQDNINKKMDSLQFELIMKNKNLAKLKDENSRNSNNYDLLNDLQVAQGDIKSLTLENEKLQRLYRNLQNQSNWKLEPENSKFQKKHEILVFKRKVAENKAKTQKFIVHMKKENAEIIEQLKEKLQIYMSKCNDLESNDQLLNIKES